MKFKLLFFLIWIVPLSMTAQTNCKVLLPALDSIYDGKCKKGLAHGNGEAWGDFHYTGKFKNGYPEGKGRAEYNDGTVYEGSWEKGLRHGEGKLYFVENGEKLLSHGIWENDEFKAEILPPPYQVIRQRNVNRLRVYKEGEGLNVVTFFTNSLGGVASAPLDLQVSGDSGSEIRAGNKISYEDVTLPFKGRIRYNSWNQLRTQQFEVYLEIQVNEAGRWVIEIQN